MSYYGRGGNDPPPRGGGGRRPGGRGDYHGGGNKNGPAFSEKITVTTNCFQAKYTAPLDSDAVWHQYMISMAPKKFVREAQMIGDGDLPPIQDIPDAHPKKVERFQGSIQKYGSTELSREILKRLSRLLEREEELIFATDGAAMGYSPKKLFDEPSKSFGIALDHNRAFWVTLEYQGDIPLKAWQHQPTHEEEESANKISQCLDTLFKHAMNNNLIAVGKSPNTFFLNEEYQRQLITGNNGHQRGGPVFAEYYRRPTPFAPFIGISQAARYCDGGKFMVAINNKVEWMFRDGQGSSRGGGDDNQKVDIPLLDVARGTLAGIRLPSIDQKITDNRKKEEIANSLSKLTFKVQYTKGEGWVKHTKERGKSEKYTQRYRTRVSNQQRLGSKDPEATVKVKWSCDEETFEKKEGEGKLTLNVQTYFEKMYDVKIRYPHLPIVSTRQGWFPVEFLYQEIARVPIDAEKVNEVLRYHDTYAGRDRIDHICKVKELVSRSKSAGQTRSLEELLNEFSISVERQPVTMDARRLAAPSLCFANSVERNTQNGTWNLARKTFSRCAELSSCAVVDIGNHNLMPSAEFMPSLFRVMHEHGMRLSNHIGEILRDVTVIGDPNAGPGQLFGYFDEARQKAVDAFLKKGRLFKGNIVFDNGHFEKCIVTRGFGPLQNAGIYAIHNDAKEATHTIVNPVNGKTAKGRVQFVLQGGQEVDPYELNGRDSEIVRTCYRTENWGLIAETDVNPNPEPLWPLKESQVECPAMIIFYIPEKRTDIYDCIKMISDIELGISTQVIVQKTCSGQKRIEQYCSNVALKINSKLTSPADDACAWTLQHGLSWPREATVKATTMIIGYSLSHGVIRGNPATAVAGSVCLSHPMQMGQSAQLHVSLNKSDVVDAGVLKALVKSLAMEYFEHVKSPPTRLVVYRDGGSDGSFERIRDHEVAAIRAALCELNRKDQGPCPNGCQFKDPDCQGCKPPKITFVVAQKDHNMRVAPANESDAFKNNVPSGTLVDGFVTSYESSEDKFDFLLIPQGGLKGTSKPMHYRVLANENSKSQEDPLTKELLYKITYEMAFQYGSATKAPRKVPVLLNSEKLASRVIKYGGYLSHLQNASMQHDDDSGQFTRTDANGETKDGELFADGVTKFKRFYITG